MGILAWLRGLFSSGAPGSSGGAPRSANGASSFHLFWEAPGSFDSVSAVLTVVTPPAVHRLYFWALQVSFGTGAGAHVGLQQLADGKHAANWGGYGPDGSELSGTPAGNTRPFPWEADVPYTLSVRRGQTGWVGTVAGPGGSPVFTRELVVPGGSALSDPMVWAEVFARCDDPSVVVRWSDLRVDGAPVQAVRANYQAAGDGGCANTDSSVADGAFVQTTAVLRVTPQGGRLEVQA
ncbi:MAG TPA: hypothetical protein VGO92_11575 [Acidimicrobiales bacterium]|nr:hypothetical protein [Acidimicrobiales bacterium]